MVHPIPNVEILGLSPIDQKGATLGDMAMGQDHHIASLSELAHGKSLKYIINSLDSSMPLFAQTYRTENRCYPLGGSGTDMPHDPVSERVFQNTPECSV